MKQLKNEYCNMLSRIQPEKDFQQKLVENLTNIQKEEKRPETEVHRKIVKQQIMRAAVFAMLFFSIIFIGVKTPVSAAIYSVYQRFFMTVPEKYEINASRYDISIEQEAVTKSGGKIWIEDAVLTDKGINLRYIVKSKGTATEIYPGDVLLKTKKGTEISLRQAAYMPVSSEKQAEEYYISYETESTGQLKKLLKEDVICNLELLEEKGQKRVTEYSISVTFKPDRIYQQKTLNLNYKWIQGPEKEEYCISKITLDVWYMKVDYRWKAEDPKEFMTFELSDENGREYVTLDAQLQEENQGKFKGTVYYELTDSDTDQMVFSPVKIQEQSDGSQKETKVSGDSIKVEKGEIIGENKKDN